MGRLGKRKTDSGETENRRRLRVETKHLYAPMVPTMKAMTDGLKTPGRCTLKDINKSNLHILLLFFFCVSGHVYGNILAQPRY